MSFLKNQQPTFFISYTMRLCDKDLDEYCSKSIIIVMVIVNIAKEYFMKNYFGAKLYLSI